MAGRRLAMAEKKLANIFISYSREDSTSAKKLYASLKHAGLQSWLDRSTLVPGEDWVSAIDKGIRKCDVFLLLCGEGQRRESSFVERELQIAFERAREDPSFRIIPVLLPGSRSEDLPIPLKSYQAIDLRDVREPLREFARIAAVLLEDTESGSPAVDETIGDRLRKAGDAAGALPYYERSLRLAVAEFGEIHPSVASLHSKLGVTQAELGEYDQALLRLRHALEIDRSLFGDHNPTLARDHNSLGAVFQAMGRFEEARQHYEVAVSVTRLSPKGEDKLAAGLSNLAALYFESGEYYRAEELMTETLRLQRSTNLKHSPSLVLSLSNLAVVKKALGRFDEAEELYREALTEHEVAFGENEPALATILNNLGGIYRAQGRNPEARSMYSRALNVQRTSLGSVHPDVAVTLSNLAGLERIDGNFDGANLLYSQAVQIQTVALGPEHPSVAATLNNMAQLQTAKGNAAEAETLLRRALSIFEKQFSPSHPDSALIRRNLALLLLRNGRGEEGNSINAATSTSSSQDPGPNVADLPSPTDRQRTKAAQPAEVGIERGTVRWFNAAKGFCFIQRANGDNVFVHVSAIDHDGHLPLEEGTEVQFRVRRGPKGLHAQNITAAGQLDLSKEDAPPPPSKK